MTPAKENRPERLLRRLLFHLSKTGRISKKKSFEIAGGYKFTKKETQKILLAWHRDGVINLRGKYVYLGEKNG